MAKKNTGIALVVGGIVVLVAVFFMFSGDIEKIIPIGNNNLIKCSVTVAYYGILQQPKITDAQCILQGKCLYSIYPTTFGVYDTGSLRMSSGGKTSTVNWQLDIFNNMKVYEMTLCSPGIDGTFTLYDSGSGIIDIRSFTAS